MCKVMIFSNSKKMTKNLKNKINFVSRLISESDDDGFGWAAVDSSNKLVGERTTNPEMFNSMLGVKNFSHNKNVLPNVYKNYNSFGDLKNFTPSGGALMFHGRTSTNARSLLNTHPIIKNGWAIIHNGVVTNIGEKYKMQTTNDTEHVAHYLSTKGIEGLANNLTGYYAVGAIDDKGNLHVVRDKVADLVSSYIPSLESYIFATTADLIKDFCEEFKYTYSTITSVIEDTYLVLDKENNILDFKEFKSLGMYSSYEREMMSTSLHYKTDHDFKDDKYWEKFVSENTTSNVVDVSNEGLDEKRNQIMDSIYSDVNKQALYLDELQEFAKYDYIILDKYNKEISYNAFRQLDSTEQLQCLLVDPVSGEPVDPDGVTRYNGTSRMY